LEKSLKVLFTTRDVTLVRRYVQKQLIKMLEGRCSPQDCVYAKEYRGMAGYKPRACVPSLELARYGREIVFLVFILVADINYLHDGVVSY